MIIVRPDTGPREFEGIANCFEGKINGAELYPLSNVLAECDYPPVELIVESGPDGSSAMKFEVSADAIRQAVSLANEQYLQNVGSSSGIEERFQDYLTEDLGLSRAQAIEVYKNEGIAPFLLLTRVFISQPLSAVCLDFACYGEDYLEDHEFSLDRIGDSVEFVTPRGLMPEGSYPASRNQ